jgi:sodium pump decarboxylase gamma subunit
MLNSLLAKTSIPEAALYAVLGFAIVFLGISFLILVVGLVGKVMNKTKATPKAKETQAVKEEIATSLAVSKETEEISEETIAVITAAIMAYYQQTQQTFPL